MQPDTIQLILKLPDEAYYIANVIIGWLSLLNQATYHMHNFGYDKLPRLWQSYCIFIGLSVILYFASIRGQSGTISVSQERMDDNAWRFQMH